MKRQRAAVVDFPSQSSEPWGKANDRRGVPYYNELAKEFVKEFPLGTYVPVEAFDQWLQRHSVLVVPDPDASKNSDAWKGHLHRRSDARKHLNNSGAHPRMSAEGSLPFAIRAIRGGYEIMAPHDAVTKIEVPVQVHNFIETKRKQVRYLMQSADFASLPQFARFLTEVAYDDTNDLAEELKLKAARFTQKIAKLEHRIRLSIAAGVPAQGVLRLENGQNQSEESSD